MQRPAFVKRVADAQRAAKLVLSPPAIVRSGMPLNTKKSSVTSMLFSATPTPAPVWIDQRELPVESGAE